ncbi:MAG: hypothetical protein ACT443_03380 [Gemmatimonadota bacterium]
MHLNLETLARLVDESPDEAEAGHLDSCEACLGELEALRADAAALRLLPDPEPRAAAWTALERHLRGEGLMRRRAWSPTLLRLAALLAVFVLGSLAGGWFVRSQTPQVAAARPVATPAPAETAEQAVARLREAERAYVAALSRYSDFSGRTDPTDPLARLAALEGIVATTRAALGQAPADPVINGYHLTAVAQRDATLRQLAASGQTWY